MVTETDRAWLAGIIDGEGSISLFAFQEKDGYTKLKPSISFVNTDLGIINKALEILEQADCSTHIHRRELSKKNPKHKDVYEVKAGAILEIEKFLLLVSPYLSGDKKAKAEILLRFVRRRKSRREQHGRNDLATYTPEDWDDLHLIRSSTTTRETSSDDDIVCPTTKVLG